MNIRVLAPPSWQLAIAINKWASKLRIKIARHEAFNKLILIGDGIPDAIAYLILAHKFDGKSTVGVTTTEEKHIMAVTHVPIIVKQLGVQKIVLSLDQEEHTLENLKTQLEERMREKFSFQPEEKQERYYVYACSYSQRTFKLIITVNGLDLPSHRFRKHTIEDHLLSSLKEISNDNSLITTTLSRTKEDPKETWRLLRDHHYNVYSNLLKWKIERLRNLFPQQISSLEMLENG